jgi:hypothetical protein
VAALSWLLVRVGPIGMWETAPEMPELTAAFRAIATSAIGLLTPRAYLTEVRGLRNIRPKQAPLTLEPNEARPWSR